MRTKRVNKGYEDQCLYPKEEDRVPHPGPASVYVVPPAPEQVPSTCLAMCVLSHMVKYIL